MKITHYMSRFRLEDGGVVRAVLDMCTGSAGLGPVEPLDTLC